MPKRNKKIFNLILTIILICMLVVLLPNYTFAEDAATEISGNGGTTDEVVEETVDESADNGVMITIQKMVGQWYYIFRYFSIAFMLVVLIFLGIKLAITSIAEEKAKYKRMLVDWVVGFIMIFGIHYFMAGVLALNDICVSGIEKFNGELANDFIKQMDEDFTGSSLYETIRTRAYEFSIGIGTSGMIMYMVLVYYTLRFIFIYFKRFFTLLILTIMAPIAALSYAFTKINSGKAQILGKWAEEYAFNVFLQSIHALMYGTFVTLALALSNDSIAGFILAFVMLNFMLKAEKIFRKIFKISGKLLDDNADKDIKENLATATAAIASFKATKNSGIVKDAKETVKRGVGAATNVGLYAGLTAYDKILQRNEKHDKDYQKVIEAKENIKNAKPGKERDIARAKLENLINSNSKLAGMEGRRNKLKRYKGQNESKTALGALANKKNIERKANALIAKEESQKGPISEERKNEIRKEVAKKHNDRIKRRVSEYNEKTGRYELKSGIAKTLKADLNYAIWGDGNVKQATKQMTQNTLKGIKGAAMMVASVPQIVANPVAGLALLAAGSKNAKLLYGKNDYKKITNTRHRRIIRKGKKNNIKKKQKDKASQKYTHNRFNAKSLETIKAQMRMDMSSNMIFRINNPSLSVRAFTMPLRLTGAMGAARKIQEYSYQVDKAKYDRYKRIETDFTIEKKNSYNMDFIGGYHNAVSNMEENVRTNLASKSENEILLMHKEETGAVFTVNDKKMQFKNNSISSLTQTDLIDNAILKIAVKNHVSDLSQLDLNNDFVKLEIIQELGNLGILVNTENIKLDQNQEQITALMGQITERIESIQKENPEVLQEKLTQIVVTEYMQKNGIENIDELKSEEHRTNIKEEVLARVKQAEESNIEEEKPKTEDEILDERISRIVDETMEISTTEEEFNNIVQTRIEEMFIEIYEQEESQNPTTGIKDELNERKAIYTGQKQNKTDDIIKTPEELIQEVQAEKKEASSKEVQTEAPDIVKTKTKIVLDNIMVIIDNLTEKKSEKERKTQEQIDLIDEIIDGVEEIQEDTSISLTKKEKLSTKEVLAEIIKQDAKREVRKSNEFKDLNDGLRKVDEFEITSENLVVDDEIIEENISEETEQLVSRLLLLKNEDAAAIKLKVKEDGSENKKLKKMDMYRAEMTYNDTGLNDIIAQIKKQ